MLATQEAAGPAVVGTNQAKTVLCEFTCNDRIPIGVKWASRISSM